jgi:dolichol-phosphate mannosyltransferase
MIHFIIPAYNELQNLPELFTSLEVWAASRRENCAVIVVDDGSTDGTGEFLENYRGLPLQVISHRPNQGVSAVFRSGLRGWKQTAGTDGLVVTLEADNTSSLEILDEMIRQARAGSDVVLASCYMDSGEVVGTNWLRTMLSFCANLILRCTPGMPKVNTFSSFYRVYRASFLSNALTQYGDRMIEEEGFVCVVEMLLKFGILGAEIVEVPLRLDGSKRKGPSKMKILHTIRGYIFLFLHASTGKLFRPAKLTRMQQAEEVITR